MEQIKFSVSDETHWRLQALAKMNKRSLSEEVRYHVERSIALGGEDKTDVLLETISKLADLVQTQTGHQWFDHPGAAGVFMEAVVFAIQRATGGPMGRSLDLLHYQPAFDPAELPVMRPVAWEDQNMWGASLESVEFFGRKK